MLFHLFNREISYGVESNKPNYKTNKEELALFLRPFNEDNHGEDVSIGTLYGLHKA
ncbi:hypothetical protein NEOC84_000239|nr:hypothetical protein [Neochlamydia sp. AcF84]